MTNSYVGQNNSFLVCVCPNCNHIHITCSQSRNSLSFTEPKGSLLYSQKHANGPYPDCIFPPYFLKIRSNIIFPHMPRSSEWFLPFRSSNQTNVYAFLICSMPATFPTNLILPNNIWCTPQCTQCTPLSVRDQISHPYKTGTIMVLCILIFKFLDRRQEDKTTNRMTAGIPQI